MRGRRGEEDKISPRHEGLGQTVIGPFDSTLRGERAFGQSAVSPQVDDDIRAEGSSNDPRDFIAKNGPLLQLDGVTLSVRESDALDALEARKRPGKTRR